MTDTPPLGPLPELVPCPLCGAHEGYTLDEGSTFRWWSVKCAHCGQEVAEARAPYPNKGDERRTVPADSAWNGAGAYAHRLRQEIERLRAYALQERAAERERCAQWVRDNYQDHPHIDSLCEAMTHRAEPGEDAA